MLRLDACLCADGFFYDSEWERCWEGWCCGANSLIICVIGLRTGNWASFRLTCLVLCSMSSPANLAQGRDLLTIAPGHMPVSNKYGPGVGPVGRIEERTLAPGAKAQLLPEPDY